MKKIITRGILFTFLLLLIIASIDSMLNTRNHFNDKDQKKILMNAPYNTANFELINSWHYSSGNTICESMITDSQGNFYLAGWYAPNLGDICVLKLDPNGTYIWHSLWQTEQNEMAHDIAVDSNDNIYVVGSAEENISSYMDSIVLKHNSSGNLEWEKIWGSQASTQEANAVAIDSNDNIYVVGTSSYDVSILKCDSNGSLLWTRTWGGPSADEGYDIMIDSNDMIYITGYTRYNGVNPDVLLLKYNTEGDLVGYYTWGSSSAEEGRALIIDTHSNVYITGTVNLHHSDIFMLKLNKDFNLLWNETWGGDLSEKPNDIGIDQKGIIYVVGETASFGSGNYDFFLCIYDQNVGVIESSFWGDTNGDYGETLLFKANKDLYLGGFSTNVNTSIKEMVLLKLPYVPNITGIIGPGYNMWLVIGIVIMVSIFTSKIRLKKLSKD